MRDHADHHDAELLLRLYDLRREAKLRQAREWMAGEFQAESPEEYFKKYPRGSTENAFIRMVLSYWDMAASIVNQGLIKEEFFFENTSEFWAVWAKFKHLAPALRESRKNPYIWKNLENLAERFEKWTEKRAPEALETLHALLVKPSAAAAPKS
ncbi:MAG: hypothetical protein ABSB82_18145 [Terriglobia bacterium]|jgi:hypothetical protein